MFPFSDTFGGVLQFFGIIATFVTFLKSLAWIINKITTPKLKYDLKRYQISDKRYYYICCLWNPKFKDITSNDVTKDICFDSSSFSNLNIIKYTDNRLKIY